jgi:hypothetical protein
VKHKTDRKVISSKLSARFEAQGQTFLLWIVHHFELETKRQSTEWHHPQSARKKKFKKSPSAGKVMITVFWGCQGIILVDAMPRRKTINSNTCIKMLPELGKHFE